MADLTLGPISQQVKRRASPKQWRRIVKRAHKAGFAVESYLDQNIPTALKQRTQKSLRQQAKTTISAAYAPAEKELSQAEEKTKAIDTKRANDNRYYLNWLEQRRKDMETHTAAADARLREENDKIVSESNAAVKDLRGQIAAAVTQQPGVVSDPSTSTALDTSAFGEREIRYNEAARQQTEDIIGNSQRRAAEVGAINFAQIAALEAKRTGDTWAKLSEIGDERQKLKLGKAADIAKEVSRLLDVEVDKANTNREASIIERQFNLDKAKVNLDILQEQNDQSNADREFKAKYGISPQRYAKMAPEERLQWRKRWARAGMAPPKKAGSTTYYYGYDAKTWQGMTPAQRINAKVQWDKAGKVKGGDDDAKGDKPQNRFSNAYSLIAVSTTPGKPGRAGKPGKPGKQYSPQYVANNPQLVINQLVAKGYSRRIAAAAVAAYISRGGEDPGSWRDWVKGPEDRRPT